MRTLFQSLASLSGLRIQSCHELWCRLQMRLRSDVAVALVQAGGYNSDSTPSLGTSICRRCGPKKTKTTTKNHCGCEIGTWDPFPLCLYLDKCLLKQQNTETIYGSKNNCMHGKLGQSIDNNIQKKLKKWSSRCGAVVSKSN